MSFELYLISALIGSQFAYLFLLILNYLKILLNPEQIELLFLLVIGICILIFLLIQSYIYNKILNILLKEKDIEKFKKKCAEEIKLSINSIMKRKLIFVLTDFYIQQGDFNSAIKYVKKIKKNNNTRDFNRNLFLSMRVKLQFYLRLISINLKLNNIIDAQIAFVNAKKFIDKYKYSRKFSFEIAYTLGLLEYAKGNYFEAKEFFNTALDLNIDNNLEKEKDIIKLIAKISLKTKY